MAKRGWMVVAGMFVLALMLTACGSGDTTEGGDDPDDGATDDVGPSGDGNPDDAAPSCGNGNCEEGEGCSSCAGDCSCTAEYTVCRNDACVDWDVVNPLLKKLEGQWTLLEPWTEDGDVYVDLDDPVCVFTQSGDGTLNGYPQGDPGDACVHGLYPPEMVISGNRLQFYAPYDSTIYADGQVFNDGARVEIDKHEAGASIHLIWVKN